MKEIPTSKIVSNVNSRYCDKAIEWKFKEKVSILSQGIKPPYFTMLIYLAQ